MMNLYETTDQREFCNRHIQAHSYIWPVAADPGYPSTPISCLSLNTIAYFLKWSIFTHISLCIRTYIHTQGDEVCEEGLYLSSAVFLCKRPLLW